MKVVFLSWVYTAVDFQIMYLTVVLLDLVVLMHHYVYSGIFPFFPIWVLYFMAGFLGGGSDSGSVHVQILELLRSANLQAKETYAATVSEKVCSTRESITRKS